MAYRGKRHKPTDRTLIAVRKRFGILNKIASGDDDFIEVDRNFRRLVKLGFLALDQDGCVSITKAGRWYMETFDQK